MSKRRNKIDKRKVRNTVVWSLLVVSILSLLYLSVQHKAARDLSKVMISVKKESDSQYLITKKDIVHLIEDDLGYGLGAVVIEDLDLRRVEDILAADDRVARSEIYLDSDQVLHIYVQQRHPILRVKSQAVDYYLDDVGEVVSIDRARPVRVPIVTGIHQMPKPDFPHNDERTILNDVFEIAQATQQDEFLTALVEQIHVDDNAEVWVIPKVGDERLLLGDASELDDRLQRLKIIYREGMQRSGFNQYAELHFKWKGQVTRVKDRKS